MFLALAKGVMELRAAMENKITRLFEEHKANISDVARRADIPYGTLYDIAKGKTPFERVSIGHVIKIAHVFGMTADELIGDTDLDEERYELIQIYDSLGTTGRRALVACAQGLHDAFMEEAQDAILNDMANDN